MSLKFERSQLKVEIYGNQYTLTKPTFGQAIELERQMKDAENSGKTAELVQEFLVGLGLPKEVSSVMESEHLLMLIEHLSGKKK